MRTVDHGADDQVGERDSFAQLPERVQEALGELAGAAKEGLLALIEDRYLSLRRDPAFRISADFILDSVEDGLDPTSPRTALGLAFLGATALCLAGWAWLRRPAWLWPGLLVVLITVDLLSFARDFHPTRTVAELTRPEGAARFLADQPGLHRHLHLAWPPITTQPNRLIPLSRSDAGGYSSLASDRIQAYLDRARAHDGVLLDLMNVRYVLAPTRRQALPEHQGVQYAVDRPLSAGAAANPNSALELATDRAPANELRLIGFLRQARAVLQGTPIGSVRVRDTRGGDYYFPLVAGENMADELAASPGLDGPSHLPVQVAYERPSPGAYGDGARTRGYLISLPFGAELTVDDVAVTYFSPEGQLHIVGAGLVGEQGAVTQLARRTNYRAVYEDAHWTVHENLRVMPRAFLAYDAVTGLDDRATRDLLATGPFDARRQIVLDRAPPADLPGVPPELAEVAIDAYDDRRVTLSARTGAPAILVLSDAMYPGWQAAVDGTEAPILTADTIFRAVYLAPGEHRIEFTYDPASFKLGAAISLGTLGLLAVLAMLALRVQGTSALRGRRPSRGEPVARARMRCLWATTRMLLGVCRGVVR